MELAASIPIFISVTIFSLNSASFIFAADFCDRACKDCARAAGQMSTPDEAVNAMNAAAASHTVDGVFFQQLTPELLVYQDYNNSQSNPTPAYGSTAEYNGENGADNTAPAKDSADIPQTSTVSEKNKDKSKDKIKVTGSKDVEAPHIVYKNSGKGKIDNIASVLTDPHQTITPGPYVVVRTTMLLHIPVTLTLFGFKLFAGNVESNPQLYQFQSTYTYPITNTYVPI
jgi:hypothetical protein